jgi:hypothetical protein
MSMRDVRTALAQALVDGAFFEAEDLAWENVAFEPRTGDKPWCKFTFVPTTPVPDTLGQDGLDMVDGFVQLDLNYPLGTGDDDVMQKYVALAALFKTGARFTSDSQVVVIKSCGRTPGREFNGFYRISATIVFYAQIQR